MSERSLLRAAVDPFGLWPRARELGGRAVVALLDTAARRAIRQGIVERVVDELLAEGVAGQIAERVLTGPELDRLLAEVVDDPRTTALVEHLLDSEGMDRIVAQVLESRLIDATVARILASDELWLVVDEIARSPSVTEAIAHQGEGFADQVADEIGERSRRADVRLERVAHRLLHPRRRPPEAPRVAQPEPP